MPECLTFLFKCYFQIACLVLALTVAVYAHHGCGNHGGHEGGDHHGQGSFGGDAGFGGGSHGGFGGQGGHGDGQGGFGGQSGHQGQGGSGDESNRW
ncbi:hypothetical protein MSG28_008793 [Choristoneura fumiferana]|uniref:Uncharacterized protein n=1 Tax=Choristoneura fumiferana TaxID=7141 RepID=A0ACC0J818_CHOFU|nr:hypothetical protein MSG28_008793 [Choristoneura fumiferana]